MGFFIVYKDLLDCVVSVECRCVVVWSRAGMSSCVRTFIKRSQSQLGQIHDFEKSGAGLSRSLWTFSAI
jgi:hypothetical protein